jgi:hypothetical protein
MKGILVSKPSIHAISCLGIIIEFFMFLFDKVPIIKKSFLEMLIIFLAYQITITHFDSFHLCA